MNKDKRPIIGILTNILTVETGILAGKERIFVNRDYIEAIIRSGGVPLMLPIVNERQVIHKQIEMVDALLISGGQDINPSCYGENPIPQLQETLAERDSYEIEAIRHAFSQQRPILGICRGMQILNVAFGGSLYQDISHYFPAALDHAQQEVGTRQGVTLEKNSKLYRILGVESLQINSLHHQSAKAIAPGFTVNARAADGIIEGIEREGSPFVMGVQWHPEMMIDQEALMLKLFGAFVAIARGGGGL